MRTMLLTWLFCKPPFKFRSSVISTISSKLISLQSSITYEFYLKQRSLGDLKQWNATEYRPFLCTLHPLSWNWPSCQVKKIYTTFFSHFMLKWKFFWALHRHQEYANDLLHHRLKEYVHLHSSPTVIMVLTILLIFVWSIDIYSAFKIENFLYSLKRLFI